MHIILCSILSAFMQLCLYSILLGVILIINNYFIKIMTKSIKTTETSK